MKWSKVAGLVKGAAPLLGTALELAGPGGMAASKLVSAVLGTPEGDEGAAATALRDPDQIIAMKKLEQDHAVTLQQIQLEEARLEVQDRTAARQRETAITQATGKRDVNMVVLGWTLVLGFFAVLGVLLFKGVPEGGVDIIFMMFGTLQAAFTAVIAYHFGSSAGSKAKDSVARR